MRTAPVASRRLVLLALSSVVMILGALLAPASALAVVKTWTGLGGDDNWLTAGNWVGGAPSAGDDLVFPAGAAQFTNTNNFAPGTTFNSITFNGDGYDISGNNIGLNAGGVTSTVASGATDALNINLALGGAIPFTVTTGGATLILGGAISGVGGSAQKAGDGTLRYAGAGANTYTGTTTVNAGRLELGKTAGVNAIPGPLTIGDSTGTDTVRLLASNSDRE